MKKNFEEMQLSAYKAQAAAVAAAQEVMQKSAADASSCRQCYGRGLTRCKRPRRDPGPRRLACRRRQTLLRRRPQRRTGAAQTAVELSCGRCS